MTAPMIFSLDNKTDVGSDRGTPVGSDYAAVGSESDGRIDWIQIDLGDDAADAERYRIAVVQ